MAWILVAAWTSCADAAAVDAQDLRPGLVTVYRATARPEALEIVRIEPAIALALKTGEASHPRLAAAGGTAHLLTQAALPREEPEWIKEFVACT